MNVKPSALVRMYIYVGVSVHEIFTVIAYRLHIEPLMHSYI